MLYQSTEVQALTTVVAKLLADNTVLVKLLFCLTTICDKTTVRLGVVVINSNGTNVSRINMLYKLEVNVSFGLFLAFIFGWHNTILDNFVLQCRRVSKLQITLTFDIAIVIIWTTTGFALHSPLKAHDPLTEGTFDRFDRWQILPSDYPKVPYITGSCKNWKF